jgi:hypothetical protein
MNHEYKDTMPQQGGDTILRGSLKETSGFKCVEISDRALAIIPADVERAYTTHGSRSTMANNAITQLSGRNEGCRIQALIHHQSIQQYLMNKSESKRLKIATLHTDEADSRTWVRLRQRKRRSSRRYPFSRDPVTLTKF